MPARTGITNRAGPPTGLPFLLTCLLAWRVFAAGAGGDNIPAFLRIDSSCIDLAHYDATNKTLTVHFTGKRPDQFYRYQHIPPGHWEKLQSLNATGGVGKFINERLVNQPKLHPYEELTLKEFRILPPEKAPAPRAP